MRVFIFAAGAAVATAQNTTAVTTVANNGTTSEGSTTDAGAPQLESAWQTFSDLDGELTTSTPWGPTSMNTTGQCDANACLGASCYDWGTIDGLDRTAASISQYSGFTFEESDLEYLNSLDYMNNATEQDAYIAAVQALVDAGDEQYDFYETLETFACCDCAGCMRYTDCLQDLTQVPGNISCATIWDFLLPTVYTEEQMLEALNTLNAGGCYWCPELQSEIEDTTLGELTVGIIDYDFEWPEETTTTTTTTFRTSTTDTSTAFDSCATLGCGGVGDVCSCARSCPGDEAVTGIPCCEDYDDAGCEEQCTADNYQVNREGTIVNGDEVEGDYFYYDESGLSFNMFEHYSCDDIIGLFRLSDDDNRFDCESLENLYGLDCGGCYCAEPAPAPAPAVIPACSNENANCGFGWVEPMSCDALISASRETLGIYPDELQSHLTCASLEALDCDCEGCACERTPECLGIYDYGTDDGEIGTEVLCMGGYSCDYWVQRLPTMTCETLENEYGCNCNYCECDPSVPDEPEEPECECAVSYEMESLNGTGGMERVTCDTMSSFIQPDGLCCGVMEYAFEMDCSGCCCEVETCDTCLVNTTTVPTTTVPTTTTAECPADSSLFRDCEYTETCLTEDSEIPTSVNFKTIYDCSWIPTYLDSAYTCLTGSVSSIYPSCTTDAECTQAGSTCVENSDGDDVCSYCIDNIPGAEELTSTTSPCYYVDHPGNPEYTAYDCVEDHLNGPGCIYINATYNQQTESFCQIILDQTQCPNPPEDCIDYCVPTRIALGGCTESCGGGVRQTIYTCPAFQNGIDCRLNDDPPNCISQGVTEVGAIENSQCNNIDCAVIQCRDEFIGDGFCDWTANLDRFSLFVESEDAVNNNLEFCNWDGGDCCAYTCESSDPEVLPYLTGAGTYIRGEACIYGGGGCLRATEAEKDTAFAATSDWFNPGGGQDANGVVCEPIAGTSEYNCCLDAILFSGSPESDGACSYGASDYDDCATQGGRCLDPNAPINLGTTTPDA